MRKQTFTPEELDSINSAVTEWIADNFPDLDLVALPGENTDVRAEGGANCQAKNL